MSVEILSEYNSNSNSLKSKSSSVLYNEFISFLETKIMKIERFNQNYITKIESRDFNESINKENCHDYISVKEDNNNVFKGNYNHYLNYDYNNSNNSYTNKNSILQDSHNSNTINESNRNIIFNQNKSNSNTSNNHQFKNQNFNDYKDMNKNQKNESSLIFSILGDCKDTIKQSIQAIKTLLIENENFKEKNEILKNQFEFIKLNLKIQNERNNDDLVKEDTLKNNKNKNEIELNRDDKIKNKEMNKNKINDNGDVLIVNGLRKMVIDKAKEKSINNKDFPQNNNTNNTNYNSKFEFHKDDPKFSVKQYILNNISDNIYLYLKNKVYFLLSNNIDFRDFIYYLENNSFNKHELNVIQKELDILLNEYSEIYMEELSENENSSTPKHRENNNKRKILLDKNIENNNFNKRENENNNSYLTNITNKSKEKKDVNGPLQSFESILRKYPSNIKK